MARYKLFSFLNDINTGKKNILQEDPQAHTDYSPWIINIGMSLFTDTVLYANEINELFHLPKNMQYDYYINSIRKRKRFTKWPKKLKPSPVVELIMKEYSVNRKRAEEYFNMMDDESIARIKNKYKEGGLKGR